MEIEDLKRLRRHVDLAIDLAESGGLVEMTEGEKMRFKIQFGDFDIVIGDFKIKVCNREEMKPL